MKFSKYKIIKKWKKDMRVLLKIRYPDATMDSIDKYLDDIIEKNIVLETLKLHNNYENKTYNSNTLEFSEFFYKKKPLTTEHGTLFDNELYNPAAVMLTTWAGNRNGYKARRKQSDPDSYDFFKFDLLQLLEKIKMNSWYGVSGAKSSVFYNLYVALAITGKGQTLIATATMTFEMFLSNSVLFRNMDECLVFIKNVVTEERNYNDDLLDENVPLNKVYNKLYETFGDNKKQFKPELIYPILLNLSKEDLNRLYYKNNLYEFCRNSFMKDKIRKFINKAKIFNNPNKIPDYLKKDLNEIWNYIEEYVFYNYPIIDRSIRLKTQKRKSAVVIDTDSNVLNLHPWYEFVMDEVLTDADISKKEPTILRHIILYLLAANLSEVIALSLEKFLRLCNVPEERIGIINMKNEYLFSRMIISEGKKNYASLIEFKEGQDMGNKLDIKGLTIGKSVCNRNASKIFQDILEYDILKSKEIDIPSILGKLRTFENEIKQSLLDGETTYLTPASIKDFNSYKDPLREQPVLATIFWNLCEPDEEMVPPENIFIVKLNATEEKIENIKDEYPDKYELIKEKIYNNPEKRISKKGLYVIAIPKTKDKIPKWLRSFIDTETICADTMRHMMQVLKPLGINELESSSGVQSYSNIIDF